VSTLVSIVVPVFNGMPHLRELTESLLAQTHTDLEIVFSEGGSTDDSPAFLASITDQRVRIIHQDGSGAAGNWTTATEAARAGFIKLVCQDDLLAVDAIERQLADLEQHPDAVMAIGQRDIVDAKGDVLYARRGLAGIKERKISGSDLIRTCYLQGTNVIGEPLTVLFRAEALRAGDAVGRLESADARSQHLRQGRPDGDRDCSTRISRGIPREHELLVDSPSEAPTAADQAVAARVRSHSRPEPELR
jgi:glycosyltransferase involved in cell wall biosynthesis